VNADMILTTDHEWGGCDCERITRIISVSYPVEAEIHVRACAEVVGTPLLSAMDALGEAIGRRIIAQSDAFDLLRKYSNGLQSKYDVLTDVPCVLSGAAGRRYYLKRDILKACGKEPKKKCVACGERNCMDRDHWLASGFADEVRRMDGYVYFMLHAPVKFLKVGYSATPAKRLQTHRASIPGELTTLGVVPGGRLLEQAIHEELCDWLVPGHKEWFFYSEVVRDYVDRIVGVYKDSQHA
jgi:hypothetical protein